MHCLITLDGALSSTDDEARFGRAKSANRVRIFVNSEKIVNFIAFLKVQNFKDCYMCL